MEPRVLLLTTAFNESRFADSLVRGVMSQTRRPDRWVIVDDGSSDGTLDALARRVGGQEWVRLLRREPHDDGARDRLATAAVPRALNWALARVNWRAYTHIGKLDADVELPAEFVEELLSLFSVDRSLGIAAGVLWERHGERWRAVRQSPTHAPAPARFYSVSCFEECGGFREQLGWDTIDEVYARMRGYSTLRSNTLRVHHLRHLGTADGRLRGCARHGECAWIAHYPPSFVLLRAGKVAATFKPPGAAGVAFLWGYFAAALRRVPRQDDPEFGRFIRRELRTRLGAPLGLGFLASRPRMRVRGAVAELDVLGVRVHLLSEAEALARIEQLHDHGPTRFVSYVNPHTANVARCNAAFAVTLSKAALRLADGFGIRIAARRGGVRVPAILNGTDFNEAVLRRAAARGWSVFLLGSRPGVAELAAKRLAARIPGLRVGGAHHGYFANAETDAVVECVRACGASVLMVGLGQPYQELWLQTHLEETGARLGLAVGGFFDFSAGVVPRAPAWMNRVGIEWAFRLAHEPRRFAARYVAGIPLFLWRVAWSAPRLAPSASAPNPIAALVTPGCTDPDEKDYIQNSTAARLSSAREADSELTRRLAEPSRVHQPAATS
jgi:exopolysaccharide biosynthesis WecB/TagA/CpsF family protein